MRKYIIVCLILTALCGSALFYVSQATRDAHEEIVRLNRKISHEEEAIRILKAEWSYLNRPQRLERLANKFLKIEKTKPYQFVRFEDLKIASNIITELPHHKPITPKPAPIRVAKPKAVIAPVVVAKKEEIVKTPVIKKFKDRIESLLEDEIVAEVKTEKAEEQSISKFYKNMAFRNMIGAWGNE